MRIGYVSGMCAWGIAISLSAHAQTTDSLKSVNLSEVVVSETYHHIRNKNATLQLEVVGEDFLRNNFSGNLVQTLGNIPGVHSMDIGSGFAKPMIRGLGFNRITVTENGVKQEGQQWGADHGLEIDAFNAGQVSVRKGPSSLLYGSDAMGGAIEINALPAPAQNMFLGEVALIGKSVNGTLGGSLMLGLKHNAWFTKLRYTEMHFADYRIPTDTVVYLTRKIPVYNRRMKNTAGFERDVSWFTTYRKNGYDASFSMSNAYQKTGFFPGAHGIPDLSKLTDDGNSRNIELPYSFVNHLKVALHQGYAWGPMALSWDLGYQNNHREEWSSFHTHYDTQQIPQKDPDKELAFRLNTYSSNAKLRFLGNGKWEHTLGWDVQYQDNNIAGYSFLLPEYTRVTTGGLWLSNYKVNSQLTLSGGVRYDYGKIKVAGYTDAYLEEYLVDQGYDASVIEVYKNRSYAVNRDFGDYSASVGFVWNPSRVHMLKANVGRSFRLPGANELASNGVHHGTFRHEQGVATLKSEQGWQADAAYTYEKGRLSFTASPFFSWFDNYIFLRPTGEWSVLPDAGQIYRYTGAEAIFTGAELSMSYRVLPKLTYQFAGDYVYTYNCDEHLPLSFSPPASMRNTLTWEAASWSVYAQMESIAAQNRVDRNEDKTSGSNLFHLGGKFDFKWHNTPIEVTLTARNVLDRKYFNHLSFYRKVEIPEPGRNLQVLIKIPFKQVFK